MRFLAPAQIDYRSIRPVRGSRHAGFEELCVSLFREEIGNSGNIIRIDGSGGDGGVEAYFEDTSEKTIGLQAKYFAQLRAPQWRQIAESIQSARKSHPSLRIYYIAVPLDLNPHTAEKWKALQAEAHRKKPALQLIWWGASELTGMLTTSRHAGRAAYWFGCAQFGEGWLAERNQEALKALDTRYTPKLHVRVALQDVLSALAREPRHIKCFYEQARMVWKAMHGATEYPPLKELAGDLEEPFRAMAKTADEELPKLGDGESLPSMEAASLAAEEMRGVVISLFKAVKAVAPEAAKIFRPGQSASGAYSPSVKDSLGFRERALEKAMSALRDFQHFIEDHIAADRYALLVTGEAGAGKSHILARFVEECTERGQLALFFLGEFFTTASDPWSQLVARLGWKGDFEDLLAVLNYAGEVRGLPSILVIDAVNESPHRDVWLRHLAAFASRIEGWPWVRLVVSCRSDFVPICFQSPIAEKRDRSWAFAEHDGFGDITFEAVAKYFEAYGVRARDLPPLLPGFENPLFLKTFCEAFQNSAVPPGAFSLDTVMRERIMRTAKMLEDMIDCPADVTREAVDFLALMIAKNAGQPVAIIDARLRIDALFPGRQKSRSLFQHLCSSGLLTEVVHQYIGETPEIRVRFAYERFSDYFVANRLLAGVKSLSELVQNWSREILACWKTWEGYHSYRGLLQALAILLPEKFNVELENVISSVGIREPLLIDFLASLSWRSPSSITSNTYALIEKARSELGGERVLVELIRMALVVGHPFNTDYLDRWLHELPLPEREIEWTIPISRELARPGGVSVPPTFIRWLFTVDPAQLSDEQARLVSTLLCWFFSSNDRGFRNRVTLAAIHIVAGRCNLAVDLIEAFHAVDDLYIVERVFAVAAGVAVREKDPRKLAKLAAVVWRRVFALKEVPPHILLRDFAFTIMECAQNLGCLPSGVSPADYSPPYRSRWPKIWSEKKARAFGKADSWNTIVHSIEPEYGNGIGGYGDFGRYVMEAYMHRWLSVRLNQPYPPREKSRVFEGLTAMSWILQRVAEPGWTPERFGEYERSLRDWPRSGNEDTKQERISKKYQWIALHELEGYASDHFHFDRPWDNSPEKFEGAWQLWSRNFDPAQPIRDPLAAKLIEDRDLIEWRKGGSDPFADKNSLKEPSAWVSALPEDPSAMLVLPSVPGLKGPFVLLNAWFSWDEPEPYPPRTREMGKCRQFMHFRSWIVPQKEVLQRLKLLREMHFWGDGVWLPEFGREGLGEYPWSSRFECLRQECAKQERFGGEFPPGFVHTVAVYSEGGVSASLPSPQLMKVLSVKWTGNNFNFYAASGEVVAFSPWHPSQSDASPCLVNQAYLLEILAKHKLALIWALVGDRRCYSETGGANLMSFSGVFTLTSSSRIRGGITIKDITAMNK